MEVIEATAEGERALEEEEEQEDREAEELGMTKGEAETAGEDELEGKAAKGEEERKERVLWAAEAAFTEDEGLKRDEGGGERDEGEGKRVAKLCKRRARAVRKDEIK